MSNVLSNTRALLAEGELSQEAWAILAGQGLGDLDRKAGVFDDTPPSDVPAEYAEAYRTAYYTMNPDYAVD